MRVLIGIPTHDGRIDAGTARAAYASQSAHEVTVAVAQSSLIDQNCNTLWCAAIAHRERFDFFALLHSDVEPKDAWIDTLIAEAQEHDADLMSAVCCVKSNLGLTSTALAPEDPDNWNPHCRITLKQLWAESFPATFCGALAAKALRELPDPLGVPDVEYNAPLWVNTGCILMRLSGAWADPHRVYFSTLSRNRMIDGQHAPEVMPEDWNFARLAAANGARVFATRKVRTLHRGISVYDSSLASGEWSRDEEYERIREAIHAT